MTRSNKLKIGLALNAIGMLVDDENLNKIKDRLTEIEQIVSAEPTEDDKE